jgi:GT2 family glycosyltransferase
MSSTLLTHIRPANLTGMSPPIDPSQRVPKISVVIPTLNREECLCDTIRYFLDVERYPLFEVIVIDQSERHDATTEQFLVREASRIRLVVADYRSLTKARNHGARLATGEIVAFVDDDVEPSPGFLSAHASAYDSTTVIGATGPILKVGETLKSRAEIGERAYEALVEQREMRRDVAFGFSAQWAAGGNMSFRRSLIVDLGGFDEIFYGASIGEDAEFSHRATKHGKIRYIPEAALVHKRVLTGGTHDAASQREYTRQLAFCVNYFWFKLERPTHQRWAMVWRAFRHHVLNRQEMASGQMLPLGLAFCTGVAESARVIRRTIERSSKQRS